MRTHLQLGAALAVSLAFACFAQGAPPKGQAQTDPWSAPSDTAHQGVSADSARNLSLFVAQAVQPATAPSPTPTSTPAEPGKSPLNFNSAELNVVLKYISDKTGKPVVQTGELKDKKITIINPRTQTDQENLQLLYKMLSLQGIAVVDMDDLINVMPLVDARKGMLPIAGEAKEPSKVEEPVTYSRALKYVKAQDLVERLKPLVRDPDALVADAGTNTILYTDTRSFVNRFEELITHLDTEPFQEITTSARPVRNLPATELLPVARRFLQTFASITGEATPQTVVRVEPSLNTLILKGPAREVQALTAVLDRLDDRPRRELQFTTQRRKVNHADPETLIREGNAFLHRQSALLDFMGDMSKTTMMYEPVTRELVIRGPSAEIEALLPFLDELDAPMASRPRKVNYAEPQALVDDSLKMLIEQYAEEGRKDFKHAITWKPDPFDPSTLIFRGPVSELDRLFPILDRFDKPTTTRSRRFYKSPEEVFPEAFDLLVDQYLQEGRPGYKHAITWRRDPLNSANIVIRGPEEELNRLFSILDRLDKSVSQRTRQIYSATPEVVIPQALERVIKMFAEEGVADLEPSIQWKRDDFNPSLIVFRGPPDELDHLFQALDLLDKPTTTQQRRFYNRAAEEVIPEALALMLDQYKQEGRPDYRHSITWRRDTLNPALVIFKGPPEELARLTAFIEQLDKATTERTRRFYTLKPEEAIPQAISALIDRMDEQGQSDYRPSLKWKPDRFNPTMIVFQGPPAELDMLIPLLDQIDKPTVVQQRRFFGKSPEEVLPKAYELLLKQYEQEGWPGYQHSISWTRDPLNPALINLKGPQEELSRLAPVLERLDKTLTERSRVIQDASPEQVIPDAIARMLEQFARDGQPNYEHSIEWRRDEFNPAQIIFRAPPAELDALFPILDRVNPPLVISSRAIQNMTPELIIQPARERLKQYFVDQNRPEYEPKTTFRIDPLNQNLVMRGPQEEITALTTILSELDAPRMQNIAVTTQEFPYGFAEPADLIQAASQYLARRVAFEGKPGDRPGVTFQVNPLTRSITLRGPATQLSWVTPILTAVEQSTRRGMKPLVIYPKKTSATVLYSELYQLVSSYYPGPSIPQILQLPRLDAVLVSAREEDMPRIREWVNMLDREGGDNWAIRVVPIKNSVPSTVASAVRTLIPPTGGVMHTDDAAARIIIRDSTPAIERIIHLIDQIDQPVEGEDLVMQVKNLKTASAYYAYNALNEFSSQLALIRGKSKTKARVVYEPTSSSILFFGTRQDVDELMQVAEKLDRVALAETKPQIVKLNNAQAATLYGQLSSVLPRITSQQSPPVLIPDSRLNALIVATAPSDATKVLDLIRSLDSPGGEGFEPKFVRLKNAEPYAVSSALSPILSGSAKIIPDQRTSSLIIYDSTENVRRLMPFIEQLDSTDGLEDFVLETYRPTSAYSYYLYLTLSQYASLVAPKKGKTRTKTVVQYDTYTNMVILMGPKEEVQDLIELAKKLDTVTFQEARPKIIPLKNLSAPQFTSRLSGITQGVTSKQTPPLVIPDTRLNSLIVAGTPADVSKITEIVQLLDIPGSGELSFHIHPLKNAEASTLTSTISSFITSFSEVGKVFAEPRTNSLLILDSTESIQRLIPIIEGFDTVESRERFVVDVIPTKTANVYAVYNPLSMYAQQLATLRGNQRSRPQVIVDPSTQSIIVIGRREDVEDIKRIADDLDKLQWGEGIEPEFIPLKNATASTVASSITRILPSVAKGGASVQIVPDDRINQVIVVTKPDDLERIKGLIEKLDMPDAADLETRIIPIENAVASYVYSAIYSLKSPRGMVTYDVTTNSVIIRDNPSALERLVKLVKELDVKEGAGLVTKIIPLKNSSASSVYYPVTTLKSARGYVNVDVNSNSLIIRDTSPSMAMLEGIIADLDMRDAPSEWVTEIKRLRHLDPSTVSNLVTQLSTQIYQKQGRQRPRSFAYPEPSSNSVVIVGVTEEVKPALDLIDRLEQEGQVAGNLKLFFLKNTRAQRLATQLRLVFQSTRRGTSGLETAVISDEFTNSIIAIGSEADLERLEELITKLDIPNAGGLQVEIFPLEGVSASTLSGNLQPLLGPQGSIFAEAPSNSLVLIDSPEVIQRIGQIVKELSQRKGRITTRIRKLEFGVANNLVTPINQYLQIDASRTGRPYPSVNIYPEPSSNSVLIFGPTSEVVSIERLIDQLDTQDLGAREPRIFPLRYIPASQILAQFMQSISQSTVGALRPVAFAEPTRNLLIVMAADTDLKRIEEVLKQLDVPESAGLETRVYQLKHSSAATLAPNLAPPITSARGKAFADVGTNSLVVIDTPESHARVQEFIERIDLGRGQIVSRVRRMENATISTLSGPLQQFLAHQARTKGLTTPLTQILSDPSSNTVIIYGPTDEVEIVMGLLDELDAQSLFDREPEIVPLTRAQAAKLAPVIQQLLAQDRSGANAPRVVAEPESNTLIVLAPHADLLRAKELIARLDQVELTGIETRVFHLKNADPQTLATNLRGMVGNPAKLFFDPVSNSLVYTDTPGNLENLAKIITQLDTFSEEAGVMRVVRPLRNTSASTVDVALSDFAQYFSARKGRTGRPLTRVAADVATNSVLIIGPSDEVQQMVSLLEEMDRDNLRERQPKTFFLKQAQAQQVATQLTTLMAQLGAGPNMARIVGNQETNSLLVLATPTDMVLIEQMINSLDSDDGNLRRPQIFHLKNADAVQLVTALRPTIGALAMIAAHGDSNSVLYTDTETNVQRLFAILEQLDAGSRPEEISSEIVALVNTKAGNIMQPLQTIVTQLSTVRRRANKPPLQTFADPEANAIVVVGATEEVTQIARIVRQLDAESLTERKPEIFTLEYARASDLARSFTTLFATTSRYGTQSRIVADEWSNSLIVIADPRDMTWIRQLIKELDTREGRKRVVEIFILENADASSLAEKLTNLFVPGTATGGRSRTRSYWDDLYGYGRRSMALTEGEVSIIPDLRLNALVVTAEPQDMTQVAELIEALDIEAPNLDFRIYHVENGESEQLADTLTSLFTDTEFQSGYYYPVERDVTVSGLSGKIRVIAEPTTNSLIVLASSPRAFEVVEQMLKELDRPSVQAGRTNIIPVRNARAKDLQELLTKLFRPEENAQATSQRRFIFGDFFGGAGGGAGSGSFSNLIGKVRIEADTRTNSLLVITPELYRPSVEQIISELDRPTNQVLLEVLIVEVTLGNEENKGIQWGVDPTTGEVGRVAVSNTEILTFDNDRTDFLSPDDFTNNVYNFGADSLQFFSLNRANFQAVLNFLETCRQVNVQSRPNILTADNRKARVEVVLETPFVKEINVTNNTTNSSVEYRDVGLILDVTPRINSATEVTLDVRLQDGNIDPTIPPLNGTAFTFSRRQFETQLVVNNHHTVVLAGVISERSADQTHQVPVLWRLPVVGNKLFTNKAREKSKVELLTFITPYILRSRMDVLTATEMTRGKSGSQALKRVDLTSGDWPDVYVDEQQPSREEGWRQPVGAPPR